MRTLCALLIILALATTAVAYSGRRAVLYTLGEALVQENLPYRRGLNDCSMLMWKLFRDIFPELRILKGFRRTTCEVLATWPWQAVMRLGDREFGDELFTGYPTLKHVLMQWDERNTAIHTGVSRGTSKTKIYPYWAPKIELIIRPPY